MLQQFKRAIGVAIVRGNANHKLGRMHYVRGRQRRQLTRADPTTATTDTNQAKRGDQAGTRNTPQKGIQRSNNSEMGMLSACLNPHALIVTWLIDSEN